MLPVAWDCLSACRIISIPHYDGLQIFFGIVIDIGRNVDILYLSRRIAIAGGNQIGALAMRLDWDSVSDISASFDSRDAEDIREALRDRVDGCKEHAEELAEWRSDDETTKGEQPECEWEPLTDDEQALLDLLTEWSESVDDWRYGVHFIHESDFEDEMRELAEGCGYIRGGEDNPLLNYIDWEAWARDCRNDYSVFEANGQTFYVR